MPGRICLSDAGCRDPVGTENTAGSVPAFIPDGLDAGSSLLMWCCSFQTGDFCSLNGLQDASGGVMPGRMRLSVAGTGDPGRNKKRDRKRSCCHSCRTGCRIQSSDAVPSAPVDQLRRSDAR